jgi:hypothetical protein
VTKEDFCFERDYFPDFLMRQADVAEISKKNLWAVMCKWPEIVQEKLKGQADISVGTVGERVSGSVLGKKFSIDFSVQACVTVSMIEAVLSVPAARSQVPVEVGRFWIAPSGQILSRSNETLLEGEDDGEEGFLSEDLLIAVLRKVMQAPLTL